MSAYGHSHNLYLSDIYKPKLGTLAPFSFHTKPKQFLFSCLNFQSLVKSLIHRIVLTPKSKKDTGMTIGPLNNKK